MIWWWVIITFAVAYLYFILGDMLLRYEYENHHSQWIRDGKPVGWFWRPEEGNISVLLKLGIEKQSRILHSWTFSTPEWIRKDRYAAFLLWAFRLVYGCLLILAAYLMGYAAKYGDRGRFPP